MLNAKLFGALAIALLLAGLLTSHHVASQIVNLPALIRELQSRRPTEFIVINGFYFWLFYTLNCAVLALAYFVLARCSRRPRGRIVGTVGFVIVVTGILVKIFWHPMTRHYPMRENNIPLFLLYAAAYNAFYLGSLLCVANLVWLAVSEAISRIRLQVAS